MKQILPEISKTTDIDNYVKQTMPALRNILNNYQVKYNISYGDNFFPSKTYKGIKYPAGYYNSLVITLGQGLGENFWCVMYPPLCLIDENKNTTEVEYKSYVKDVLLKYN
ncbi:stage II sporulation protein R [Mycoplasma sp. CAG:956]|nr:stage II sporulation protein R [Mycoplasma sp. CAG:956]